MKKEKKQSEPTGNDIHIYFDSFINDRPLKRFYKLRVKSLGFQLRENYRWEGVMDDGTVWVEYDLKTNDVIFSDNYPNQFQPDATAEIKRITRQFN
ncbi:MAG: hypothetical protein Q7T76_09055 [Ferruginibacter sp.]|nr:hypothetical protein [Ferruginibacter sp.]